MIQPLRGWRGFFWHADPGWPLRGDPGLCDSHRVAVETRLFSTLPACLLKPTPAGVSRGSFTTRSAEGGHRPGIHAGFVGDPNYSSYLMARVRAFPQGFSRFLWLKPVQSRTPVKSPSAFGVRRFIAALKCGRASRAVPRDGSRRSLQGKSGDESPHSKESPQVLVNPGSERRTDSKRASAYRTYSRVDWT